MAPSPAAGKTPTTPTKAGKSPASNVTPKLNQAGDSARKPPKLGASKLSTPKNQATSKASEATDSPQLPPRPKQAQQPVEDVQETADDSSEDAGNKIGLDDNDDTPQGKISQPGNETEDPSSQGDVGDLSEQAPDPIDDDDTEEAAEGAKDTADDTTGGVSQKASGLAGKAGGALKGAAGKATGAAGKATDTAKDAAGDVSQGDVSGAAEGVKESIQDTPEDAKDTVEDTTDDVKDTADETTDDVKDTADETAGDAVPEEAGDAVDGVKDTAEDTAEGAQETAEGAADEAGEAAEGAQETAEGAADEAGEAVEGAQDELPDIPIDLSVLKGLEVSEEGKIMDQNGEQIGQLEEGDWEDLVGQVIGDEGEILDEDGDVIGRCTVLPEKARELYEAAQKEAEEGAEGAKEFVPDISALDGLEVGPDGNILNEEGDTIGQIVEGNPADFAGAKVNAEGEVLDEDGDVIGRAKTLPQEVQETAEDAAEEAQPDAVQEAVQEALEALKPDLSILAGKKLNKKGKVLDEEGEPIGQLAEGYDLSKCAGQKINENGEILDKEGNVIGKVEIIEGEAAEAAMKDLHPDLVEQLEEAQQKAEDLTEKLPDISILEGLKVNKKGEVLNEDGEVMAKLAEGYEISDSAGKKINEKGEVLDKDGNVVGKVELVPEAFGAVEEAAEEAGEAAPELPPLSILEGMKVNKSGKIIDEDGNPIGQLVEGDAKKLSKAGVTCDAEGRFWDSHGNIIGRAETLPAQEDEGEEAPFAGLEGLIVVKDGWVEDENQNRVGQLVEGDPKKLVGRAVDEDGDVIDKRGNVVGHAERWAEEEEPEAEAIDLSSLEGLTVNKQGNVIGPEGVPVARLVEGNAKELAGRKIDAEGQIWNDAGKVVGRVELIPQDEREEKPEGIFGGLEGLVVGQDGWVVDEEGNVVGRVIEGDAKKLIGRAVDEDGDIVDKYGNVKGRCEPYEAPEEEPVDLSSLAGKVVNKQGNVVDEHGTIFGRIAEGDPAKLAGRKVDGQGQIWSDDGKAIGRAELIPGAEQQKPEGPFAGFENLTVNDKGLVVTEGGDIVGRVVEGDAEKLEGRKVDEDGDILDKSGNSIGKAERWKPEEKEKEINPMCGHKVNQEGEVRDDNGEVIGKLTEGNLKQCIGREIDEDGYVVDNNGNQIGVCTLIQYLEEEGPTEDELKAQEDAEIANKMSNILTQTMERIEPVCKMITEHVEKADRTPRDELDEEQLVQDVKPLIEEGSRILQECNGAIRGLDPDGHVAANAKARAANREATPEEYRLADQLKELTTTVVKTIDNAKKRISDMPHAKKKLNPLWGLLTEPLFQILAAVGLLLAGVLGLVGRLLSGLGLGGLVNGLLGGLGIDKLLGGLGLGSIGEALGFGGDKKKKK